MKYCSKCILSDKFFSVKINEDGLCNYCVEEAKQQEESVKKSINENVKEVTLPSSEKNYDVVLALSLIHI